jgi:hypothetical protein
LERLGPANSEARRGERPANPIFKGRCRYCGALGRVRYMVILANGQWRKTGPFCNNERACWERRHPPMQHTDGLEDIYGE